MDAHRPRRGVPGQAVSGAATTIGFFILAVLLSAALGACAGGANGAVHGSTATDGRFHLKLDTDSALQRGALDANPLLSGAIRFKAPDQFLNYSASYALKPGDNLLRGAPGAPSAIDSTPTSTTTATTTTASLLGAESIGQSLSTRLPFLFAAPLTLGVEDRYRGLLTPAGLSETRTAQLNWAPTAAKLGLQWSSLDPLAPQPFDCTLRASIDVRGRSIAPAVGAEDRLKLVGGGCRVFAPERGIANLEVNTWSAAWQWRGGAGDSAVQFSIVEPLRSGALLSSTMAETIRAPGYELGASRTQTRGRLSAKTSVAVRRAADPASRREAIGWSARTTLSRQFDTVAVSASLQHAADPLWFVPASTSGGNSVELGFDFRRWIERQLSTRKVGLGLTWSWIESPLPNQPIDARVLWNFSLTP